jgi:hypothetical protein
MCKRWDTPKDFALSQAWLFKVNRDVDVSSGSGDEYRVTTGFAKLVCAAQNAKMRFRLLCSFRRPYAIRWISLILLLNSELTP